MAAENLRLIVKNDEIVEIFNENTFEWPSCETEDTEHQLTDIINKYKSHPSIKKIKKQPHY